MVEGGRSAAVRGDLRLRKGRGAVRRAACEKDAEAGAPVWIARGAGVRLFLDVTVSEDSRRLPPEDWIVGIAVRGKAACRGLRRSACRAKASCCGGVGGGGPGS